MKTRFIVLLLAVCWLAGTADTAFAADPDPAVKSLYDRLIAAIIANDRDAFLKDATPEMAAGITPALMNQINAYLADHMKAGYESTYLTQLKQKGFQVHLWKLSFKDGSDDSVLRVVLKDGHLAGFFRH